ncbi:MAG: STAS domain-containing protein [Candidatus Krumholzibacteriota bacterium]|nr:STAS domain-containing protein [Candidatus Krumholzibacteriota bacterium]
MIIESFDVGSLSLMVRFGLPGGWRLPGRILSLAMVAADCGVEAIRIIPDVKLAPPVEKAVEELVRLNPRIEFYGSLFPPGQEEQFGFLVITRHRGLICFRDLGADDAYSILTTQDSRDIDLASNCAYLIANVMGFSSFLSFEVRLGIYELLDRMARNQSGEEGERWMRLTLERNGDKLSVSVVDKGLEFDPTVRRECEGNRFLDSGLLRKLGLGRLPRKEEPLRYQRENGYNKTFFEKSLIVDRPAAGGGKENTMDRFILREETAAVNGLCRIFLEGDLDAKGAIKMEGLIERIMESAPPQVELDFQKVQFISSAGVGILLGLVSSVRSHGGEVKFTGVLPKIRAVFKLLNLDDFFIMGEARKVSLPG